MSIKDSATVVGIISSISENGDYAKLEITGTIGDDGVISPAEGKAMVYKNKLPEKTIPPVGTKMEGRFKIRTARDSVLRNAKIHIPQEPARIST